MLSAKFRKNWIQKMRRMRALSIILMAAVALIMGGAASKSLAEDEIPFDDAEVFFELNNTDGDLGIHALIDGEAWEELEIGDPNGRNMLDIRVRGRLGRQGLTELFFESAEPSFDDLDPADFFLRFPEGIYTIEGETLDDRELENEVELTHLLPAPPVEIEVSHVEIDPEKVDCDRPPQVPIVNEPVTISWEEVTTSYPELGRTHEPIEVVRYQVVVEQDDLLFSVDLPPEGKELELPSGLLAIGEQVKFEILVREDSRNQTAVESCFVIEVE